MTDRDPDCGMCSENPSLLRLCDRCAKNLEMLDLAQGIQQIKGKQIDIAGVPCVITDAAPPNTLFLVPSRAALERVLEHDEAPDLRRYVGAITNLG